MSGLPDRREQIAATQIGVGQIPLVGLGPVSRH